MSGALITIYTRNGALPMELIAFYGWCMAWAGDGLSLNGTPVTEDLYKFMIRNHTIDQMVNLDMGNKGAKAGMRGRNYELKSRDLHDQMIKLFPGLISSDITEAAAHQAKLAKRRAARQKQRQPGGNVPRAVVLKAAAA